MRAKLLALLSPPTLKDEQDQRASILNAILLSALVGLGLFFLTSRLMGLELVPTTDILIMILMGVMFSLLILVRKGKAHIAGILLLVFGWLALSYQAWITGGFRGTAFFANVLVILAASLLVGSRTSAVFAGLGIASAWLFGFAEDKDLLLPYAAPPYLAAFELTVILLLAAVLVYLLIRNMARALQSAKESNRQLQLFSNDLENQVVERTRSVEAARAEAEAARQAMESRVWLTTRQAELSNCMRGEQDVPTLATNVVRQLCRDLDAAVGTLYLLEGDVLQLAGGYANALPASMGRPFRLGEGLIGQAALEKKVLTLTDLPHDYIPIYSGLGRAAPRTLIMQPFLYDGHVVGVLELGTLTSFSPLQLEYLQAATENIAIAFNTAGARDRINELLLETQAQARALRVQEEELRTANAELERTADMLRDQQETLDAQNQALRATRAELEERAVELERASRYKSEFLANMSHELRTPLNSLLILARMLADNEEGNLTADQVESARIVYSSGHDLLNLINDILDLSKIEAGKMEFQIAPMAFGDLVRAMEQQFSHIAADKKLRFETVIADSVPPAVQTDQRRIEQVMRNLLSNAFKFTEAGTVRLEIDRPAEDEKLSQGDLAEVETVALRVRDTGIGMTKAQQAIVFEGFQQADGSTSRKYGGTGLGLTISRELVTQLGGRITLTSAPNEGSTFSVILPLMHIKVGDKSRGGTGALQPATAPLPAELAGQRVATSPLSGGLVTVPDDRDRLVPERHCLLIIEDDTHFARIVADQAHQSGFQCLVAGHGEGGLKLAAVHRPDAIVLDLHLPGMSGWDVLRHLKADPHLRHIPVHIFSVEDEHLDAYRMGAMGFLTKPVNRDDLALVFQNIEDFISRAVRSLLIVEDDPITRKSLEQQLTGPELKVTAVATGQEALLRLQEEVFDCVVLDLYLPDMSGFDVLMQFNDSDARRNCPVIVYTGKDLTAKESAELLVYADNVITKGIDSRETLLQETTRFLHRVVTPRAETVLSRPSPTNSSAPPAAALLGHTVAAEAATEKSFSFAPSVHILAVDDDVRNAVAISRLLGERGLRVTIARSGSRAIELLEQEPGFSLILMDIMMPEMDGYDTIRRIRADRRLTDLPIIALTARAMAGDAEKCLDAGADDYLAKPIDIDQLFLKLQRWLEGNSADVPATVAIGEASEPI